MKIDPGPDHRSIDPLDLLWEWMAYWDAEDHMPAKMPNALHVRSAVALVNSGRTVLIGGEPRPEVPLDPAPDDRVPVEQLRAAIRLIGDQDMTPVAKRVLEQICAQHASVPPADAEGTSS